jgi:hypothetical protein
MRMLLFGGIRQDIGFINAYDMGGHSYKPCAALVKSNRFTTAYQYASGNGQSWDLAQKESTVNQEQILSFLDSAFTIGLSQQKQFGIEELLKFVNVTVDSMIPIKTIDQLLMVIASKIKAFVTSARKSIDSLSIDLEFKPKAKGLHAAQFELVFSASEASLKKCMLEQPVDCDIAMNSSSEDIEVDDMSGEFDKSDEDINAYDWSKIRAEARGLLED